MNKIRTYTLALWLEFVNLWIFRPWAFTDKDNVPIKPKPKARRRVT